jgi:two-component system response regulator RegA
MKANSRFLVVDDDASFRTRLVKALSARGFVAEGAGTVDEALDVARELKPDAAIVDLKMPGGKSGLELVPDLVLRHPGVQVVVLTGYGSIATALEAVRLGASHY